jgi:hypothetical protein
MESSRRGGKVPLLLMMTLFVCALFVAALAAMAADKTTSGPLVYPSAKKVDQVRRTRMRG